MPDHALTASPWWKRVLTLEPALVRTVVGGIVYILAVWGIDAADIGEQVESAGLRQAAVIIVGPALAAEGFADSHLYGTRIARRRSTDAVVTDLGDEIIR